ncbi:MAG: MBL fold metallo-hydrolase [Candidatus Eisenbacteria bacterium]|uniref:MBL fold metallo-hydrolase n=1 Tax=Eiseniibacteriota bacterium TaxID=2212470 RepID=A0A956M096_UNCEI|nr:MBL fold metallo-hydrolase [Candidatus Eisenbacteria bacterium]
MFFRQYYLGCLAHASYLFGDPASGRAAVVDPQRDVDQYLDDAKALGLEVTDVFLTHFHADFVAGHLELQARTGATIHLGARASAEYDFQPAADGARVQLGAVEIETLETPGHTPESICLLVSDRNEPQRPAALLTGDTLFIGDVGRPDLMASAGHSADELARFLYRSLHEKILVLPDETLVYPAHGAGSMCGRNLSTETVSTLGTQRLYNYALRPMSEEEFVSAVTRNLPTVPAYFAYDAETNRKLHPTLDEQLARALRPMSVAELAQHEASNGIVLDVRTPEEHAAAHWAGAINIGLGGKYATWAGSLLDRTRGIALIADPGQEEEAATRLGRIGFDHVVGYLEGGMAALREHPERVSQFERVTARGLREELDSETPPWVLDIRSPVERETASIAGTRHIPLDELPARAGEVPRDRRVVIHCAAGYRSMIAASLLRRAGVAEVSDLIGGISAWQLAGFAAAPIHTSGRKD